MRLGWIREQAEGKIVDIGGNNGHTFGENPNVTVVDIDLYDIPNFVRADAQDLPFKDKEFDTAVLAEILEHVPDPVKALKEAKRVAKKVVITVPNEYEWQEELKPFNTLDKEAEREGLTPLQLAIKGNPDCKEFHHDLEHLYHCRWYTRETLEKDLKEAGYTNYKIHELTNDTFHWFGVCES
jgi:ubiquinone/menaquinone biosynthesis C-methylase UbiE